MGSLAFTSKSVLRRHDDERYASESIDDRVPASSVAAHFARGRQGFEALSSGNCRPHSLAGCRVRSVRGPTQRPGRRGPRTTARGPALEARGPALK